MKAIVILGTAVLASGLLAVQSAHAGSASFIYDPDQPYLSIDDSPFPTGADDFALEDFEDGLVDITGVTIDGGILRDPSNFTDSVDADDGTIDGSGTDGHSYWQLQGTEGFTISFDEEALGGLPTLVGFVWTDGNIDGVFRLEAFDADGVSIFEVVLGNLVHTGTTEEDRFIGVDFDGGIASLLLSTSFGGIEIDHLQYAAIVPLPAPLALYQRSLEMRLIQNERGLGVEALEAGEVGERFPILDRALDEIVGATWSPRDGLVNPNAVRAWYRSEAEALGVSFRNRHYVSGVSTRRAAGSHGSSRVVASVDVIEVEQGSVTDESGWIREALTTHRVPSDARVDESRLECDVVINCLGAWSPVFSAKIGITDVTEPVRRQISLVDVHAEDLAPGVELDTLGMIVDASGLYFHPEGPHILAGYSTPNEAPGFDFDYDGVDFFEAEIWPRLAARASSFERCGHVRGWAGLYAVTPDCSGIAGQVAGFGNLFEAHSFTGRGVMQSYAVGCAMASLVTTGAWEEVDLSALTRSRFRDPKDWVVEELHI